MITAIITAGGVGKRMGRDTYKQFLEINKTPILALTLKQFQKHPEIDDIVIVVPEDVVSSTQKEIVKKYKLSKVTRVVAGGKERQNSVKNAIDVLSKETEIVLIHDGVRPFVTASLISGLIKETKEHHAVVPALKPKDTIKKIKGDKVKKTIDRTKYIMVQTPQVFKRKILEEVYNNSELNSIALTDDASLFELHGVTVKWVNGLEQNIKITTPADLALADYYDAVNYRKGLK